MSTLTQCAHATKRPKRHRLHSQSNDCNDRESARPNPTSNRNIGECQQRRRRTSQDRLQKARRVCLSPPSCTRNNGFIHPMTAPPPPQASRTSAQRAAVPPISRPGPSTYACSPPSISATRRHWHSPAHLQRHRHQYATSRSRP